MSAIELAKGIAKLDAAADLLTQAAAALAVDGQYDPTHELDTARELHLKALTLRLRLEVERQTSVLH